MDAKKTIDYSNLKEKLAELDARSFQRAERACSMSADETQDLTYSSAFRARLAAEALGVEFAEASSLDLTTYTTITAMVLNFLLKSLGEEIQPKS